MSQRSRGWIFTLNNYSRDECEELRAVKCRCMKAGFEIAPTTGTPHVQGAVYWDNAVSMAQAKKRLGDRVWLKQMRGNWDDQDYCLKDGEILRDDGEPPAQGKWGDLGRFREEIAAGIDEVDSYEQFPMVMARYPRFRGGYLAALAKRKGSEFRNIKTRIFWGPGGTNKTKSAMCDTEGNYKKDMYKVANTKGLKWFDGYQGESILVIDEFDGDICTFNRWKQLLDGHRLDVEVKGGMMTACWTEVFITSNKAPETWWGPDIIELPEFKRRVYDMIEFK